MNIHVKHTVTLLLILWASGCTVFPPKVESVPWRSEISQQGCPDISGRYKDPEDVIFNAFLATHYRYSNNSDNRVSGETYVKFPYMDLYGEEREIWKKEFYKSNVVDIHIDNSILAIKGFKDGILYTEATRRLNYFMIGCSQGSYVFRSFSTGSMIELGPIVTSVGEDYIKKENDGSLVIDKYRRQWAGTANLGSKPREDKHNRYVLEPVRDQ